MGLLARLILLAGLTLSALPASASDPAAPPSLAPDLQLPQLPTTLPTPNPHLVGWLNAVLPGGGQLLLGNYGLAGLQAGLEVSTFGVGYSMSALTPLTIDGVPEQLPRFRTRLTSLTDLSKELYADFLQEFGLKYHFVNVFDAYRESLKRRGITDRIDQTPILKMFEKPFDPKIISDPLVYLPLAIIAAYTAADYGLAKAGVARNQRMTPYSNFLFALNYEVVQPLGSGVPEEVFFRGFLQNEFYDMVPSPFFAIPLQAALFALAHAPGDGRYTAALAGLYLGTLAELGHGDLSRGIAVHFWGLIILDVETVLLSQIAQRDTPPTGFSFQINF